jgi:hypothetical protein
LSKIIIVILLIGIIFISGCSNDDDIFIKKTTTNLSQLINIGFNSTGTTVQLNLAISGSDNLTASFIDQTSAGDGSGGWINTSTTTSTILNVSIDGNVNIIGNISYNFNVNPNQSYFVSGWCGYDYVIGNITKIRSEGYCT